MIFFRALPVTGSDRNPYQATISTFVYALKKSLGEYLVWGGCDRAPRLDPWKKIRLYRIINLSLTNRFKASTEDGEKKKKKKKKKKAAESEE